MKWTAVLGFVIISAFFLVFVGYVADFNYLESKLLSPSFSNNESEKLIKRIQNIQDGLTIFSTEKEINEALNRIATDPVTLKICKIAYQNSQNPPNYSTATQKELEEFMRNGQIMNELFCFATKDMWYEP